MTTKYGIRHYPQIGTYLAFKDKFFLGLCTGREWIDNDGSILDGYSKEDSGVCSSKEDAQNNITKHFELQHKNHYVDEYVYTKEWWEE